MKLANAEQQKVADELLGTCASGQGLALQFSVPIEEIEAAADRHGVQRCEGCDFWTPRRDLDGNRLCEECR
jgi:hypothetical protein